MIRDSLHDRIKARISSMEMDDEPREEPASTFGPYYRKAAVLASFDPTDLKRSAPGEDDEFYAVLADSLYSDREGAWALDDSVRRRVFDDLAHPDAVLDLVEDAARTTEHPAQRMLEQYLRRTASPLDGQSLTELLGTLQITRWLPRKLRMEIDLPEPEVIQGHIDRIDLLQPFRWLAGEHFRGRVDELAELSDYVGVRDASTYVASVRRGFRQIFSLHEEPPLVIHGVGGVGKSTLIARFILDHAELPEQERFPFVYIDFDRPSIILDQPARLLLEAVRQLGIQYPQVRRRTEAIRDEWSERLRKSAAVKGGTRPIDYSFADDFRKLLEQMSLEERPLLFVLDTFEEVQFRGDRFVRQLGDYLDALQKVCPRLRTVISGRAPVRAFPFRTRELALPDLDEEAATGFLLGHGLESRDMARRVARQVGGNPLTLHLAIEVLRRDQSQELLGIDTRKYLLVRLQSEQIQGQLYRRILWHIGENNRDIRDLVHPGLVLRRVDAALIYEVLAEPCGVRVESLQDAEVLFEQLCREVSLLEPAGDGTLRHRADVRRVMLRLLIADKPETVEQIHRRAVDYYVGRQSETVDEVKLLTYRAEELYHRLALGEDSSVLDERWIPDVEHRLAGSLDELDAAEQAYLASRLGRPVDPSIRALADLQTWERSTEALARDFIEMGQIEEALEVLNEREDRSPESPLHVLDISVREMLGQHEDAAEAATRAIEKASETGNLTLLVDLLLARAHLAALLSDPVTAEEHADEAVLLAETSKDGLLRMRTRLARLQLVDSSATEDANHVRRLFMELSDDRLAEDPGLQDHLSGILGALMSSSTAVPSRATTGETASPMDIALLRRALRLVGLDRASGQNRRALARALLTWDERYSEETREPIGRLAREIGLVVEEDPAREWRRITEHASVAELNHAMTMLLARPDVPEAVVRTIAEVFLQPADQPSPPSVPGTKSVPADRHRTTPVLKFSADEIQQLRDAILATGGLNELASIVSYRLHRSVRTVTLHEEFPAVVDDLIGDAQSTGWLADLIVTLLEALPTASPLQAFAQTIGLASISADEFDSFLSVAGSSKSPDEWRSGIGEIETQICRIEMNGSFATGFLIGPDRLLTSRRAVEPLLEERLDSQAVTLRFDRKSIWRNACEFTIRAGSEFQLADSWLIDSDEHTAILSLSESPGDQPIGSEARGFEDWARTRGWIRAPFEPVSSERTLFVISYTDGRPRFDHLAHGGLDISDGTLRYELTAAEEASGAPVFNERCELIAIHLNSEAGMSMAIPIDRIVGGGAGAFEQSLAL